jgi:hypothetical protein
MTLTAQSLTDDQIRAARRIVVDKFLHGEVVGEALDILTAALRSDGGTIGLHSYWSRRLTQAEARERSVPIILAHAPEVAR